MSVKRFSWIAAIVLLQACGGGGGGGGSKDPIGTSSTSSNSSISSVTVTSSSVATSTSSSSASSIASNASSLASSSSLPAGYPVGVADALPVLNLQTDNAAPIISKKDYVKGNFSLVDVGGSSVAGNLEVRGRGNSTWAWPKKPYRLKLTNSTSLLGMPANKHWVLLANYVDKTLMRNDIALMFSRSLGLEYTVRNQYVELNLNGNYQGVYQLVEHIRVDKNRVNIPELKVDDIAADKISGGYLLEVDFRHSKQWCNGNTWDDFCVNGENTLLKTDYCIESAHGMQPFCVDTPDSLVDDAWKPQRDYITQYIRDTEAALFGPNFKDEDLGYAAYIDVDSVINYFFVNELLRNVDGAVSSFYMYKKRDGKLFFGPVWDFDLSMGNAGYDRANMPDGWHIHEKPWFDRMFQDPAFTAKAKARWQQLKSEGKLQLILDYAEARATWLDKQQKKNFMTWSITDFESWVYHVPQGTYSAEFNQMIQWQRDRIQWMDTQFGH